MSESEKSVDLRLCDISNSECLRFTFIGELKADDAETAVEEWKKLFENLGDEKLSLIWDCLQMTGFENKARVIWQQAMKELKGNIDMVWLITTSNVIKAGAKLISTFTKFKMKVVKSQEEIIKAKGLQ